MPEVFDVVPSEVDTGEMHFLLRFPVISLRPAMTNPPLLSTYAGLDLPDKSKAGDELNGKALSTFVLTKIGKPERNWLEFRFVPPKSEDEKENEPFRTTYGNKPHSWPAVLSKPEFKVDFANPRVGEDATGPLYMPRGHSLYKLKEAVNAMSPTVTEEWISPTPWTEDQLACAQPQPLDVHWNYYGDNLPVGPCLHPRFVVPAQGFPYHRAGGSRVLGSVFPEVVFPGTFFEDWAPYTLDDDVIFIESEGVFKRTRISISPPWGGVERWFES